MNFKSSVKFPAVIVFLLLLVYPAFASFVFLTAKTKLDVQIHGYSNSFNITRFSKKNFKKGIFQKDFEGLVNSKIEGRGIFIKTYCNIQYAFFNIINNKIGKDDYLFQEPYIDEELGLGSRTDFSVPANRSKLEEYAGQLCQISEKLSKLNKKLIFYVTPSKAHVYRDKIPQKYFRNLNENHVKAYVYLKELLSNKNICFIDGYDLIKNCEVPAFYKSGIHWSRPLEQISTKAIVDLIDDFYGERTPSFLLGNLKSSTKPYWRDADLVENANISKIFDSEFYEYETSVSECREIPKVLLQGGSFAEGLFHDYFEKFPEHFYNIFYDSAMREHCIDHTNYRKISKFSEFDLAPYLDEVDFVIIEVNDSVIYRFSDGFVEYLNGFLDCYENNR